MMSSTKPEVFLYITFHNYVGERPSHGHGQHPQKFGKDRACGSGDILADRQTQTDKHTQTYSSRYL